LARRPLFDFAEHENANPFQFLVQAFVEEKEVYIFCFHFLGF